MDFKNAEELLKLCETNHCSISEIMKQREIELGETSADAVEKKMAHTLEIMRESAYTPIRKPQKSIGGLIGGEAKLLRKHKTSGKNIRISYFLPGSIALHGSIWYNTKKFAIADLRGNPFL